MQIFTVDNPHFNDLLAAWSAGRRIGSFSREGKVQIVTATKHFLLVFSDADQQKILLRPTRTQKEAEMLARKLLERERERGHQVELAM